jgi:hypothetical protein
VPAKGAVSCRHSGRFPGTPLAQNCSASDWFTAAMSRRAESEGASEPRQYLHEGGYVASLENLRLGRGFQSSLTGGLTGAGCLAVARVSSQPVRARICRERAAGLLGRGAGWAETRHDCGPPPTEAAPSRQHHAPMTGSAPNGLFGSVRGTRCGAALYAAVPSC